MFKLFWLTTALTAICSLSCRAELQRVEAENYTAHQGVKLEQTSDDGGGKSLAFISNNDFAEYSINIDKPGLYKFQFRVATNNKQSGSIKLNLGKVDLGSVAVPFTKGWQTWQTVSTIVPIKSAGSQTLRLTFLGGEDSLFNVNWFNYGVAKPVDLTVKFQPQQKMRYGMDFERLWYWPKSSTEQQRIAKWTAVDCDIDYIRVAINCAYELEEGKYNPKAYSHRILPMMRAMKAADPDLKYFASPRPLDEAISKAAWQPYPRWITGQRGKQFDFQPIKCAEYLVRYIELMKKEGFKISFLDLTNEWQSTRSPDKFTAGDVYRIRDHMEAELGSRNLPLFIAPSSWSYLEGRYWMKSVNNAKKRNAIDIAASHNTDKEGSAQGFADAVREYLGKDVEIWNTELHGWKSVKGADEALTSSFLFEAIEAGFSGINGWLAVGTKNQGHSYFLNEGGKIKRNVKYFIFKKLCNTSNYGHALPIDSSEFKSSVALLRDNLLTVWIVNDSESNQVVDIKIPGKTVLGNIIRSTRWSQVHELPVEGVSEKLPSDRRGSIPVMVKGKSVYCFEINLNTR